MTTPDTLTDRTSLCCACGKRFYLTAAQVQDVESEIPVRCAACEADRQHWLDAMTECQEDDR